MSTRKTTALYVRISEDRVGLEYGVDRQRGDGRELCQRRGWTDPVEFADNDITADGRARPGYIALVSAIERGEIARVVVFHPSRIWRNRRERADGIELFRTHKVSLVCVKGPELDMGSAYGRLAADLVGAFASAEGEVKTELINREILQKAERGELNGAGKGNQLFGYAADGKTVIKAEARQVRSWYRQFAAGRSVASLAREAGVYTSTMRARLGNPRYAGIRRHQGVDYRAAWPAIVDRGLWDKAVAILADPTRTTNGGNRDRKHLGSGLYVCGRCDRDRTVYSAYYSSGGKSRYVYRCRPELGGCSRSWHRDRLDAFVTAVVEERLGRGDLADLLPVDQPDLAPLRDEAEGIRHRLRELPSNYILLGMDEDDLRNGLEAGRARLKQIQVELGRVDRGGILGELAAAEDPVQAWRDLPEVSQRQAAVRALMGVTLDGAPRGKPPAPPPEWEASDWDWSVTWYGRACVRIVWSE